MSPFQQPSMPFSSHAFIYGTNFQPPNFPASPSRFCLNPAAEPFQGYAGPYRAGLSGGYDWTQSTGPFVQAEYNFQEPSANSDQYTMTDFTTEQNKRIEELERQLSSANERLRAVEECLTVALERVENRLGTVEERAGVVEGRLGNFQDWSQMFTEKVEIMARALKL